MSDSAFTSLNSYISATDRSSTSDAASALAAAQADADEYGLPAIGSALGGLVSTLAAAGQDTGAVAITPSASVAGLLILAGLPEKSTLTCVDPEAVHQGRAKSAFRSAGYSPSRVRFLPSRPLDVLGRLAAGSYHLVFADIEPIDFPALVEGAWPLLAPGGTLVINGSLLDGTLADPTRTDRPTLAAREADKLVDTLDGAVVARLPLDSGVTLVTRTR